MTPGEPEPLPRTVGLCPGEDAGEFYMPDAKEGDICPMCPERLVIYTAAEPQPARAEPPAATAACGRVEPVTDVATVGA